MNERDLVDREKLGVWLMAQGLCDSCPVGVTKCAGGQSNPTYMVDVPPRRFVLRRRPPPPLLPSAHRIDREFRVIAALHALGLPVPRPYILCEDESVLGSAFYLMEFVPGKVFHDPAIADSDTAKRAAIYASLAETAAQLHAIEPDNIGLGDFGRPGNYVERQFKRWTGQYRAGTFQVPIVDTLIEALARRIPQSSARAIVHGDFRLGNMMVGGPPPRIQAMLDWELATIGDPWSDLAHCCMIWRMPHDSPILPGLAGLDLESLGIPTENMFLRLYCRKTGTTKPPDWNIHLGFQFFRMAAICAGVASRAALGNANDERAAMYGEQIPLLAETGLAILSGEKEA